MNDRIDHSIHPPSTRDDLEESNLDLSPLERSLFSIREDVTIQYVNIL